MSRDFWPKDGYKGSMLKILLLTFFFFAAPAHALSEEEMTADAPTRTIEDLIKEYIDLPPGAIDWNVFAKTESKSIETKDADGFEYQYFKPAFPDAVKALDGQVVMLKGYIFPLDETEDQRFFLFGPFPLNCPFQYHVDPRLVVEVDSKKSPVRFSYDPVVIMGRLELVENDPENSVFYRLKDARAVR